MGDYSAVCTCGHADGAHDGLGHCFGIPSHTHPCPCTAFFPTQLDPVDSLCTCGHRRDAHDTEEPSYCHEATKDGRDECSCRIFRRSIFFDLTPSPARNDAETVIAGLLAEHKMFQTHCSCGFDALRDTATALSRNNDAIGDRLRAHVASVIAAHMAAPDELTALRERIRALAEKWRNCDCWDDCHCKDLHAALGDA